MEPATDAVAIIDLILARHTYWISFCLLSQVGCVVWIGRFWHMMDFDVNKLDG